MVLSSECILICFGNHLLLPDETAFHVNNDQIEMVPTLLTRLSFPGGGRLTFHRVNAAP